MWSRRRLGSSWVESKNFLRSPRSERLALVFDRTLAQRCCGSTVDPPAELIAQRYSLRGLVKHLGGNSDDGIVEQSIPSGTPLVDELLTSVKPLGPARNSTRLDSQGVPYQFRELCRESRKFGRKQIPVGQIACPGRQV